LAISERQLETWAAQGPTKQFTDTYQTIRGKLLDTSAPYPVSDTDVFLQGSYCNDTNVYGDSDVDIVLKHNGAFYYDISELTPQEQEQFKAAFSSDAAYGYPQFKSDAEAWITKQYTGVKVGGKAVFVPGNTSRRDADILVCQQFRRYISYRVGARQYHEGVAFFVGGNRIENFPKQHSDNLTAKHQATKSNFKPVVRIFKNMRNSMIDKNFIAAGVAPSYFIEGMLSNVPNDKFSGDYGDMWIACYNWLVTTDETKVTTGSGLHWLVRDNSSVCWSPADFQSFLAALKKYWES